MQLFFLLLIGYNTTSILSSLSVSYRNITIVMENKIKELLLDGLSGIVILTFVPCRIDLKNHRTLLLRVFIFKIDLLGELQ